MSAHRKRPAGQDGAPPKTTTTQSGSILAQAVPDELVKRADLALRRARYVGITGADVDALSDWVVPHRIRARQIKARRVVADVLADIADLTGGGR